MTIRKALTRLDAGQLATLCNQLGIVKQDGSRIDAGETPFLVRELEHVIATVFETKYPGLQARRFIPVDTSIPEGAESFAYKMWDYFGMAKIIDSYADDLPMVGQTAQRFTAPIRTIGDAYGYTIDDIAAALFAGMALPSDLAVVARRVIETKIDDLAAFGDADSGLPGFTNHANVNLASLTYGTWASATPLQILADLNTLVSKIATQSKRIYQADTILFDSASWDIVTQTPMSSDNTNTILQVFLKNATSVTNADVWDKLDLADAAGTGPRVIAYARTPEVCSLVIPREFTQQPPQARNLAFVVPCHAKCGGISMKYPLGMAYADGV